MSDPNLNMGLGGGQPPLGGGPSLRDEEAALKKGNKLPLVLGLVAAVAVVAGLGFVLLSGDDAAEYRAIGSQINGMKQEKFDGFWACALPNEPIDQLDTNRALTDAINERARGNPARYGSHVRETCLVKLAEHRSELRDLIPPEDLHAQLGDLESALDDLNESWGGYLERLDHSQEGYDSEAAAPQLSKIAKGWYDYRNAHRSLNDSIRGRIEGGGGE